MIDPPNPPGAMKAGLFLPNFGPWGSARALADVAADAEAAGWDGVFIWDHVVRHEGDFDVAEPWVALGAMAMATNRVALGPLVTPLPRRRPWNVAKAVTTLDHLSNGRAVLGARRRGDMLDEALRVVEGVWSGEPVDHDGTHYRVEGVRFLPRPVRAGRVPIWAATESVKGRAVRRAARLDGIFPIGIEPDDIGSLISALRDAGRPLDEKDAEVDAGRPVFDIVITADDPGPWEGTGATWWLRRLPWDQPAADSLRIVAAGPPR